MDRKFLIGQIKVWLLQERAWQFSDDPEYAEERAEDLAQHLIGNWEMVKWLHKQEVTA